MRYCGEDERGVVFLMRGAPVRYLRG